MRSTSGTTCCHFFCSAVFSMPVCRNPIVGLAETMFSPSSVNTMFNTPCVLGCCGPMLTVIVSVRISDIALQTRFNQLTHQMQQRPMHFLRPRRRPAWHVDVHVHEPSGLAAVAPRQSNRDEALGFRALERDV